VSALPLSVFLDVKNLYEVHMSVRLSFCLNFNITKSSTGKLRRVKGSWGESSEVKGRQGESRGIHI
jgi:hypothetical protein